MTLACMRARRNTSAGQGVATGVAFAGLTHTVRSKRFTK
jgi:hypothetical protein